MEKKKQIKKQRKVSTKHCKSCPIPHCDNPSPMLAPCPDCPIIKKKRKSKKIPRKDQDT